jgi:hypothetical protein
MTENLGCVVEQFLAHKRTLGRKYLSEEAELRLLVRFAEQHHVDRLDQLRAVLLDDFLAPGAGRVRAVSTTCWAS